MVPASPRCRNRQFMRRSGALNGLMIVSTSAGNGQCYPRRCLPSRSLKVQARAKNISASVPTPPRKSRTPRSQVQSQQDHVRPLLTIATPGWGLESHASGLCNIHPGQNKINKHTQYALNVGPKQLVVVVYMGRCIS